LTRRGEALLAKADVVVYDHLASSRLLELAPEQAVRICAGKSIGHCTLKQDEINELLIEHARAGLQVVRLKGGDPFVFGRGAEEALALGTAGIPFEVIPGVTAGVGVTAYAGIPLTHRAAASAVAFVTGHGDPESETDENGLDWRALAQFPGTLVVYMGVTHLTAICRTLLKLGKPGDTPAAVIESGTLPWQRTVTGTLANIAVTANRALVRPPALLVIGSVARLRDELTWFERLPLFGQRIVVTRPRDEGSRAAMSLETLGAEVLLAPTVQVRPISDPGPLDAAIDRLASYEWLVFTSANGVRFFLERLTARGRDLRALGHLKLAAIGPVTAETLGQFHLNADLVPETFRSEALAAALLNRASGCKVLLARADRGRAVLKAELDKLAEVDQVEVYRNVDAGKLPELVVERITGGTIDWVTITSPAIAARLHELLPQAARDRIGREVRLASLSPVTTEAARSLGWTVAVEADEFTWQGLVRAIVAQVAGERD
jgi:uroporphyrinogen III methyltransferase/synthase